MTRFLLAIASVILLSLSLPASAQNKTAGNIGIWSNTPTPNSLTDTGAANAPGNFTVGGNLNVTGTITGNAGLTLPGGEAAASQPWVSGAISTALSGLAPPAPFTGQFTGSAAPTNAALKALCASGCISGQTVVYRAGFGAAGDGSAGWYKWMSDTCASLDPSGGNAPADEGMRVAQATGNGCFVLTQPMGIIPIEMWGVLPTTPAATNATRLLAAINESYRDGLTLLLSKFYPTSQVVVSAACPTIIGTGHRASGLVYDAPVATAGLSIACPVKFGNVPNSFWIRLSNFAMITKVAGGGTAIVLTFTRDAGGIGPSTPTVAVDYMMVSGDNNCGSALEIAPNKWTCPGNLAVPPHYWTNGIRGTDLGLAIFQNNFIYGEAQPTVAGTPLQYNMQDGISFGGTFCHAGRFMTNHISGAHYALRQRQSNGGGCEAMWITNNNFLGNDYAVYMEGDTGYDMPQLFIQNNSFEAQLEGIHLGNPGRLAEVNLSNNITYMGGGFINNNYLDSTCIKLYRTKKSNITNNICVNLTGHSNSTYGGIGLDIDGISSSQSEWGTISGNYFEQFLGGIHLGQYTRAFFVDASWNASSSAGTAPRYFIKNDAANPQSNFITIRCGYGKDGNSSRQGDYNAGLRATADDCVNPWP